VFNDTAVVCVCVTDIIHSGETLSVKKDVKMPIQGGMCCISSFVVFHHLLLCCYTGSALKK